MINSRRSRYYPKTQHFGFKRPVYFEPVKEETSIENKEEKDNNDPEAKAPSSEKIDLTDFSFSISTELSTLKEDTTSTPIFEWMNSDIDKFDNLSNDLLSIYDDIDIFDKDLDLKFSPVF